MHTLVVGFHKIKTGREGVAYYLFVAHQMDHFPEQWQGLPQLTPQRLILILVSIPNDKVIINIVINNN